MQHVVLGAALAVFSLATGACKSDAKSGSAGGAAPASNDDFLQHPPDWSHEALSPVSDATDGHAFTVSLPAGLKRSTRTGDGTLPGYVTWESFIDLSITVQFIEQAMVPSEPRGGVPPQQVLDKGSDAAGSWSLVDEPDKKFLNLTIYKTTTGGALELDIMQRTREPMAAFDAERAWFRKIGDSFAVK